jgi:hypothetical protein
MRVRPLHLAAAGLLVLALAAPVSAASPGAVAIRVDANYATGETFTATGAFCAAGTASSSDFRGAGRGRAATFHLLKTLDCGGGDTLTIKVDAATVIGSPQDQGGWSVVSGTGAYTSAKGGGNLVGIYYTDANGNPGVIDTYTGNLFP